MTERWHGRRVRRRDQTLLVCLSGHSHPVSAEEEMFSPMLRAIIDGWRLPDGGPLLPRIEAMIRPALISGHFGSSATLIVGGIQYHLGERETRGSWRTWSL